MVSLPVVSWDQVWAAALLAGVACGGFLAGAVLAFRVTCVLVSRTTARWSPSRTRASSAPGSTSSGTSEYSLLDVLDAVVALTSRAHGPRVGSSSSSDAEHLTSTSSSLTTSPRTGAPTPGSMSSTAETRNIAELGPVASAYGLAGTGPSATLASTRPSASRSKCPICSRLRAWVAGGVSSVAERLWTRPQESARVNSAIPTSEIDAMSYSWPSIARSEHATPATSTESSPKRGASRTVQQKRKRSARSSRFENR